MKTITKIFALLLAVSLTAAFQAHATPTTQYTETLNIGGVEIFNNPYSSDFTESGLSGFNNNDAIQSAYVVVNMADAATFYVNLTIDNLAGSYQSFKYGSSETHTYTETPYDSSIQSAFENTGILDFTVDADCKLDSVELIVNAIPGTGNDTSPVPDASSTVILLGGALSALGLLKRKLA